MTPSNYPTNEAQPAAHPDVLGTLDLSRAKRIDVPVRLPPEREAALLSVICRAGFLPNAERSDGVRYDRLETELAMLFRERIREDLLEEIRVRFPQLFAELAPTFLPPPRPRAPAPALHRADYVELDANGKVVPIRRRGGPPRPVAEVASFDPEVAEPGEDELSDLAPGPGETMNPPEEAPPFIPSRTGTRRRRSADAGEDAQEAGQ